MGKKGNSTELTLDVYVISRLTHIYYARELRKLGVTMGQFPFLMGIRDHEGISQEKLSAVLRISKSTTAVIVSQLAAGGLAERMVDSEDRRNFRLQLTPKGLALIPHIERVIRNCHDAITAGFSDGEKKMLEELLRRVRKTSEAKFCPRRETPPGKQD